jgi:hypothetical protein
LNILVDELQQLNKLLDDEHVVAIHVTNFTFSFNTCCNTAQPGESLSQISPRSSIGCCSTLLQLLLIEKIDERKRICILYILERERE